MPSSLRYVFWLCCGATMCVAIATNLPPILFTTFSQSFGGAAGLTDEQLGRISAVVFMGFVAGIVIASPLADGWGAKTFVLSGLVSQGAGLLLLGLAPDYAILLLSTFLMGLGAGLMEVVLSPVVAALQPHRRATALNWMHAAYSFGAVGTVVIGSAALRLGVPWRAAAFAIIAVPAVIGAGFIGTGRLPLVHEERAHEPLRKLLRHPFLWVCVSLISLGGGIELGIAQWLPAFAERSLGYTKAAAGMSLAAFSVTMLVGRIMAGHWVTRKNAVQTMLLFSVVCIVLLLLASVSPVFHLALAACVALGFGVCSFWPTTLSLASDRYPQGGASMFGILVAFGNLGCMVVPWGVGYIAERSSLNVAMAAIAICPAIMAVVLVSIGLRNRLS